MANNSSDKPEPQHRQTGIKAGEEEDVNNLEKSVTGVRTIGRFTLRGKMDDLPQDWWFASTAIPLLAATIGPLANVLSIAALVTKWKLTLPNNGQLPEGADDNGIRIPDPTWQIVFNAISLVFGFFGNFFLLLNFTRRIRYIVALPVTIISWYFATGILIGIIVGFNKYQPAIRPGETYSQGFWHAIIAAVLYMIGSMILMVNMLGYFLGHYPQHFDLDDDQRTLILQTMMFFFWLAGGAAVFSSVSDMSYVNALYFCDVTVLTVGFGDLVPGTVIGQALVMPYAVFGIIFLGLMINSIRKFASSMSKDKVIRRHALRERERTFERTVTSEMELRDRLGLPSHLEANPYEPKRRHNFDQFGKFEKRGRTLVFRQDKVPKFAQPLAQQGEGGDERPLPRTMSQVSTVRERGMTKVKIAQLARRREKLLILREERDRFNAMRDIQEHTTRFKQYYALAMSALAFGILWCVGAAVFMVAERRMQGLTYFQALYFCYVSLLTIGYGDYSPKSNSGKAFFVLWSLMAVPTMTILVSDMGDTVVAGVNRGTFTLADWTVMPKRGIWRDVLLSFPRFHQWLLKKAAERREKKSLERGFEVQNPDDDTAAQTPRDEDGSGEGEGEATEDKRLDRLVTTEGLSDHEMARELSKAIKRVTDDLKLEWKKKYDYEEWVEFQRLFRFSSRKQHSRLDVADQDEEDEDEQEAERAAKDVEEQLDWDWIGEDSPMLAGVSESEWVLDRLCESLERYTRRQIREDNLSRQAKKHQFKLTAPTLSMSNHQDRARSHHNRHPLSSHSPEISIRSGDVSPVLSRGPSGLEIVKLNHANRRKDRNRAPSVASEGEHAHISRLEVGGEGSGERSPDDGDDDSGEGAGSNNNQDMLIMAAESARRRRGVQHGHERRPSMMRAGGEGGGSSPSEEEGGGTEVEVHEGNEKDRPT